MSDDPKAQKADKPPLPEDSQLALLLLHFPLEQVTPSQVILVLLLPKDLIQRFKKEKDSLTEQKTLPDN